MQSFAFLINPITIKQYKKFLPLMRIVPDFFISLSLRNISPFKVLHIKKIHSIQKKEIEGYIIIYPILQKHTSEISEGFLIDRILAAGKIAEKLGAKILGVSEYAGLISEGENVLLKNLKVPLTSGNTFTAWAVFEAIYRVAKLKNFDLKKSTLAVIGANSRLASLCARKLADYVGSVIITARRNREKLEKLKKKIQLLNPIEVTIVEDAQDAVKNADIVVNAGNSLDDGLDLRKLKPESIVCDVSPSFRNNKAKWRKDSTFIKGGLVKLPYPDKLGINTGLPEGIINTSLAEVMLLTFAEKFISYPLSESINLDRLEEIADIAVQHGFEVWVPEAPVL